MLGRLHLCVITDTRQGSGRDHLEIARAALVGGAEMIQLRDKTGSLRELLPQACAIRLLCRSHGALFIVNDRLDLALAAEADGAHVGQEDLPAAEARRLLGPNRILGVSTHSVDQALAARAAGADYIGFGPMFPTGTKQTGYPPRGPAILTGGSKRRIASDPGYRRNHARERGGGHRRRGHSPRSDLGGGGGRGHRGSRGSPSAASPRCESVSWLNGPCSLDGHSSLLLPKAAAGGERCPDTGPKAGVPSGAHDFASNAPKWKEPISAGITARNMLYLYYGLPCLTGPGNTLMIKFQPE